MLLILILALSDPLRMFNRRCLNGSYFLWYNCHRANDFPLKKDVRRSGEFPPPRRSDPAKFVRSTFVQPETRPSRREPSPELPSRREHIAPPVGLRSGKDNRLAQMLEMRGSFLVGHCSLLTLHACFGLVSKFVICSLFACCVGLLLFTCSLCRN